MSCSFLRPHHQAKRATLSEISGFKPGLDIRSHRLKPFLQFLYIFSLFSDVLCALTLCSLTHTPNIDSGVRPDSFLLFSVIFAPTYPMII